MSLKPESRLDWYPKATRLDAKMNTHGEYEHGYPKGAVVHFTAGRDGAEKSILGAIQDGYAYVCIQKDGRMFQAHPISKWGSHAGLSSWPGLEGRVSDELIGIEINCAGRVLRKTDGTYRTWFGTTLTSDQVRYTPGRDNQEKGHYEKFTEAQEETLIEFLLWLKSQAPSVFSFDFVIGHDEAAPGRKNDPGASLSMTMPELRARLKELWAAQETGQDALVAQGQSTLSKDASGGVAGSSPAEST